MIASKGDIYDPRVASRIMRGESQSAADYIDLLGARRSLIARIAVRLAPYDAMIMPTTANTPPRIADLVADDKAFTNANLLALRNCTPDQHDRRLRAFRCRRIAKARCRSG